MNSVDRFAGLDLSALIRSARRYWRSTVVVFVMTTASLLAVLVLWPNRYLSDAQLLVRLGRGSVAIDPTSSVTPTVSLQETRLTQVNSVKEMLYSRALVERVVDRVGVDPILAPQCLLETWMLNLQSYMPKLGGGSAGGELTPAESQRLIRREEAVQKVYKQLDVSVPKNAYTIYLSIKSGSPFLSRDLVNAVVDEYQKYHVEAHRFGGSFDFFEAQSVQAYDAAVIAQERVRDTKNKMGVLEIDSARSALRAEISLLERDLAQADSDTAGIEAELIELERSIASLDTRIDAETVSGMTKQVGDGMRQQVFNLEMQEKQYSAQLTENHPRMRAVREQLEKSKEIAKTERGAQPQVRETVNPLWQQLELTRRTSLARHSGLISKKTALENLLANALQRLEKLNVDAVELTRLNWEATIAESTYLRNAQSREQAKMLAALDKNHFSEISLIQPASLILKKVSPPRSLMAVAGMLGALFLGMFQAVLRGAIASSPKSNASERFQRVSSSPGSRARYDGGWASDEIDLRTSSKLDERSEKGIVSSRTLPR